MFFLQPILKTIAIGYIRSLILNEFDVRRDEDGKHVPLIEFELFLVGNFLEQFVELDIMEKSRRVVCCPEPIGLIFFYDLAVNSLCS